MFKNNTKAAIIHAVAAALVVPLVWNTSAAAQEPLLGQIQAFGFNFAPRGWAKCDGQILSISQNSALFALLGTTCGGDGRTGAARRHGERRASPFGAVAELLGDGDEHLRAWQFAPHPQP